MIFYYSGSSGCLPGKVVAGEPEVVLRERATLMLSYWLISKKQQDQHIRWPLIVEGREGK